MNSKYLNYHLDQLAIEQVLFDSSLTAKTESIMALGNGYLGLRSSDEEVEAFNKEDLLVNGIFNKDSVEEVPEICNLADLTQTPILLDGEKLSLTKKDHYRKKLYLKNGELKRTLTITRNKKTYKIEFLRFVSQANKHLYLQKIRIKQISGKPTQLTVLPRINGQTTNYGTQHFKEGVKNRTSLTSIHYLEETTFSNRFVAHNLLINAFSNEKKLKGGNDDFIVTMDRRQIGFKINSKIDLKTTFVLEKIMTVNTSVDQEIAMLSKTEVLDQSRKLYDEIKATSYEKELRNSNQKWAQIQKQFDVKIIGNSQDAQYDRLAFAFSIFHLNSFVPKTNTNLSIGAKGLSGEGYQGHCFWDTEFFINPNYLFTNPQITRNLLEYRYKCLKGARLKAKEIKARPEESNLLGAQYPWETAWPTDGEVCPYWGQADIVTGQQVPVASRRQEIHVSAAIAYSVDQYFQVTNDQTFMNTMGYEMIIDTAIFWSQRAEKQASGLYEIKDVMGPNEYKGNIDNNAYTNAMATKNLELAIKYIEKLKTSKNGRLILEKVNKKIPYQYQLNHLRLVSQKLKQQIPNKNKIIPENDQFLALNRIDVTPFQLLGDAGKKLFSTKAGQKRLASQLIKQADVVLLTYLLPEKYNKQVIKQNFEFYEPITTHDSSLSPTTYAIQAVWLRKMQLAYKLFKYALNIDLGTNMHSSDKGIHAGSLGAIWQSIVFGYGGMRYMNNQLHFNPVLPRAWAGLQYQVLYKNAQIKVSISKQTFTLVVANNTKVVVIVHNKQIVINNKKQLFKVHYEH